MHATEARPRGARVPRPQWEALKARALLLRPVLPRVVFYRLTR